jgi:hypothetical protein
MEVGVVNGKWTVNDKNYHDMTKKDKKLLSKVMAFKKEAYESHHKSKQNGKVQI